MNTILEVAIGIFFVFLLFSLLTSAINEAVFGHLSHLRSRVLEDSLHAILSKRAKGFSVWAWFGKFPHSLVSWIKRSPVQARADVFSDALLLHPLVLGLATGSQRCPSYLPAETFVDAALGTILQFGKVQGSPLSLSRLDRVTISELAAAVDDLSDDHARQVFSSVLAGTTSIEEARARLETWFDNSMQRVSGTYKRYAQFWLYVWATVIVVWLNVDTIEITRRLLTDAQFRDTVATSASSFVARPDSTNMIALAGTGLGATRNDSTNDAKSNSVQSDGAGKSLSPAELMQAISKLNLPIGWGACTNIVTNKSIIGWIMIRLPRLEQDAVGTDSAAYSLGAGILAPAAPCPATIGAWRLKLIGLLITIAAISQGAPFWFDLLNRVTNLRASGRPPERKPADN